MPSRAFSIFLDAVFLLFITLVAPQFKVLGAFEVGNGEIVYFDQSIEESTLRARIASAPPKSVFVLAPSARWILRDTLTIPEQVTVIGFSGGRSGDFTFRKGFDGPLVTISSWVTLQGLGFDGNKQQFQGDGIVVIGTTIGARENNLERIEVANCSGDGLRFSTPSYLNRFTMCTFDRNEGFGIHYESVKSHYTDNFYDSVHIGWNRRGGVALEGVEASTIFQNCELFHNGGPAFTQFPVVRPNEKQAPPVETGFAATALTVRDSVIRNHAGPVWLNLGGEAFSIVFADCRIKYNSSPADNDFYKNSKATAAEILGLEGRVGVFHVEQGRLGLEIRGGYCKVPQSVPFFTTSSRSAEGSYLLLGTASKFGMIEGDIDAQNAFATILNTRIFANGAEIKLKGGYGIDPITGNTVRYGKISKGIEMKSSD